MKVKNPVSQNITIFPKINHKKDLQNRLVQVHFCTQYFFSTNSSISEVWHGSDQPVALMSHCWAFSSSGLLDRLFLIFLLKISHRFQMGFRSDMLAGQLSTVISWWANHLDVVLAVWAGAKVLLEKEISISIKLVGRWKHNVLQNLLVDGCVDFGLDKTQWTNTSRRHCTPNHHRLWKLHTGLQATWIQFLSTLPPDSGTMIYKWNAKFAFIWKEDFGPLSNSPVVFLLSPGKMLLTLFLFQKWLGWFLKMSESGDSWFTDSSFSSLLVKLSQVVESALLDSILKLAVIPVACAHFPTQFHPVSQLCI